MNAEEYAEILRENERRQARLQAHMALARQVFASLDGVGAAALRTLSLGLSFAPEPLRGLSRPFESWADTIARGLVERRDRRAGVGPCAPPDDAGSGLSGPNRAVEAAAGPAVDCVGWCARGGPQACVGMRAPALHESGGSRAPAGSFPGLA